jgi:hypothetical protein
MKIHKPAMTFKDDAKAKWEDGLVQNSDPYGNGVYRFASEWATRMEARILAGYCVQEIAEEESHKADDEGITGFMYGCAVSILSHWWKWGEELRRWHNLDTQIGNEGEKANESGKVLNPAVIIIEDKDK